MAAEEKHDEDHGDHHDVQVDTKQVRRHCSQVPHSGWTQPVLADPLQVANFLNVLVNETSIAQLNLKVWVDPTWPS